VTADRDALLDVIGAVEGYARGDQRLATLLGAASRARRYLDRTEQQGSAAPVEGDLVRARSILTRLGMEPNTAATRWVGEVIAGAREEGRVEGRAERAAVVDAIGEALIPPLVVAYSGESLLPGSTLCLTERAAHRMARIAVDTLLAAVPRGLAP
jgi:hypothetical protein